MCTFGVLLLSCETLAAPKEGGPAEGGNGRGVPGRGCPVEEMKKSKNLSI